MGLVGFAVVSGLLTANCSQLPLASSLLTDLLPIEPATDYQDSSTMAAAQVIPEGGTYIDTFKVPFTEVPVDASKGNAISTAEFLEATEALTTMFGSFPQLLFRWL